MFSLQQRLHYTAELMRETERIVALTGAGISTESGIPDFRSPGSLWQQVPPVSYQDFISKPEARQQYWQIRRNLSAQVLTARPNAAHMALVDLERKRRLLGIVTQNFDGLHHDAGNNAEHIVEMHGTSRAAACTHCGQSSSIQDLQQRIDAGEIDPLCPDCGGFLKAATILFGQRVPDAELTRARELTLSCDLFLVVGSSLKVTPAASLPRLALKNDVPLIIINLEPTPLDDYAEIVIHEKAGVVLPQIVSGI
jgi:NAD-dependent protein deacetylase/lipoamidase